MKTSSFFDALDPRKDVERVDEALRKDFEGGQGLNMPVFTVFQMTRGALAALLLTFASALSSGRLPEEGSAAKWVVLGGVADIAQASLRKYSKDNQRAKK